MSVYQALQTQPELDFFFFFMSGALVHWVYPYSKLKPMNVGSTVEILRMATAGAKLAAVHFVTSTSVFDSPHYLALTEDVQESDNLAGGAGLTVGYGTCLFDDGTVVRISSGLAARSPSRLVLSVTFLAQSKWVSERILLLASSRGVPVTIFRPGFVTGHSQ